MGMPYPIETYAPLHVLTNLVALGQTVCAQSPKTLGAVGRRPLVWGCLTLWKHAPFPYVTIAIGKVVQAYGDPPEKKSGALTSRLSRSIKVIGTETIRSATYDFLLVIHGNHGHILYRFRDYDDFGPKKEKNFRVRIFI